MYHVISLGKTFCLYHTRAAAIAETNSEEKQKEIQNREILSHKSYNRRSNLHIATFFKRNVKYLSLTFMCTGFMSDSNSL